MQIKCSLNHVATYPSYSYSISHLSRLVTDAQVERAEAELTFLLSRCSGQCEKGKGLVDAAEALAVLAWLPALRTGCLIAAKLHGLPLLCQKMVLFHSKRAR